MTVTRTESTETKVVWRTTNLELTLRGDDHAFLWSARRNEGILVPLDELLEILHCYESEKRPLEPQPPSDG